MTVAVVVRPRSGTDFAACEVIAREVHRRDGYPPYLPEDDFRRFLAGEGQLGAWVAEDAGAVVGHVALHRRSSRAVISLASETLRIDSESIAVVARLLVSPDRRRQGVGRLLLCEVTAQATRLGLRPVLDLATKLTGAIALYESLGWDRLGTVVVPLGDHQLEEYVYSAPSQICIAGCPSEDVWLDPRLAVRPSEIEGRGLFASQDIPAGTLLVRLGGRLVSSAELDDLINRANADPDIPYVDTITIYGDYHLVIPPETDVHYGNHSCDPNTWHVGPYKIAARRDIQAGEEVTIDYGTSSGAAGFRMDCGCGSNLCRRRITAEDWRRRELQARYGHHWVPALWTRIRQSSVSGVAGR